MFKFYCTEYCIDQHSIHGSDLAAQEQDSVPDRPSVILLKVVSEAMDPPARQWQLASAWEAAEPASGNP